MKNYITFTLALAAFSTVSSAMSIKCKTDGVAHNLNLNSIMETSEGKYYSFIGVSGGKKIHVLYPADSSKQIMLSAMTDKMKSPVMSLSSSDTVNLKLADQGINLECKNPTEYDLNFLADMDENGLAYCPGEKGEIDQFVGDIDAANKKIFNSDNFVEVDDRFGKEIEKQKPNMIAKIIAGMKAKKMKFDEQKVKEELEKSLVATGVTYNNKEKKSIGTFSISWGYHRSVYAQSDIRIFNKDTGTDFMAYDVDAHDAPGFDQILPRKGSSYHFDVPQYQVRIAWMRPDGKMGLEISQEHLKYKMQQRVIPNDDKSDMVGQNKLVKGNYFGEQVNGVRNVGLDEEFYLEHTDGLNPISINVIRNFNVAKGKNFALDVQATVGAGFILPATLSVIKGEKRDDKFSIVGYDTSAALRVKGSYKNAFIQTGVKVHHIGVTNGKLAGGHTLEQKINAAVFFAEFGYQINVKKNK